MGLQSIARSVFATLKTVAADALVTVIYKEQTCTGLRDAVTQASVLTTDGNTGETSGIVRVDASEMAVPTKGDTMTVGGETVFVQDVRTDSVGAIHTIYFSKTRPYTGGI